jgi:adenylosuccinate synthase
MAGRATVVVGLAFGDEGKGSMVDYLARRSERPLVVRFNGGGQAAHNVVTPEGVHHTFSQFGSGMFHPRCTTLLSRHFLLDPEALLVEGSALMAKLGENPFDGRLRVDGRALVVTPFHKAMNRILEFTRGVHRHGSCGRGIGETVGDSLLHPDEAVRAADLQADRLAILREKLQMIADRKKREMDEMQVGWHALPAPDRDLLCDPRTVDLSIGSFVAAGSLIRYDEDVELLGYISRYSDTGDIIFEGAQGVLLDETFGFQPHTTWSTTTCENACVLAEEAGITDLTRLGVLRAHWVRHGPGPFPTEDESLSGMLVGDHNETGPWQGKVRTGWFDVKLAKYAVSVCGGHIDSLALTCVDKVEHFGWKMIRDDGRVVHTDHVVEAVADEVGVPVSVVSKGPKSTDKTEVTETCCR